MSFVTIYLVENGGRIVNMSDATSPDEAVRQLSAYGPPGNLLCVRVSESIAVEIREKVKDGRMAGWGTGKAELLHTEAAKLMRLYAASITAAGNVT